MGGTVLELRGHVPLERFFSLVDHPLNLALHLKTLEASAFRL
jgi:hypothetical protein